MHPIIHMHPIIRIMHIEFKTDGGNLNKANLHKILYFNIKLIFAKLLFKFYKLKLR